MWPIWCRSFNLLPPSKLGVPHLQWMPKSLGQFVKTRLLSLTPSVWGEAQESAFLTSLQETLVLLTQGPHSEKYCSKFILLWKNSPGIRVLIISSCYQLILYYVITFVLCYVSVNFSICMVFRDKAYIPRFLAHPQCLAVQRGHLILAVSIHGHITVTVPCLEHF